MTMFLLLQLIGGTLYLLSKIFLSLADGNLLMRRIGWIVYIFGVPFWMTILWMKEDYIVMGLEFGGGLMLIYGLYKTFHVDTAPRTMCDKVADAFCIIIFLVALTYTLQTKGFGWHPFLEIIVAVSFAASIVLLARQNVFGWYILLLMHVSTGTLMYDQSVFWLASQQALSACFALWAIYKSRRLSC